MKDKEARRKFEFLVDEVADLLGRINALEGENRRRKDEAFLKEKKWFSKEETQYMYNGTVSWNTPVWYPPKKSCLKQEGHTRRGSRKAGAGDEVMPVGPPTRVGEKWVFSDGSTTEPTDPGRIAAARRRLDYQIQELDTELMRTTAREYLGKKPMRDHYDSPEPLPPAEFEVLDSGERAEFPSGMVRDTNRGKIDYTLIMDGPMFERWAVHMTKGAVKYARRNWMKAEGQEELDRFRESALRHFIQWMRGETDEDHAAAVIFGMNGAEYVKGRMER